MGRHQHQQRRPRSKLKFKRVETKVQAIKRTATRRLIIDPGVATRGSCLARPNSGAGGGAEHFPEKN
jgi:hypothetical protein